MPWFTPILSAIPSVLEIVTALVVGGVVMYFVGVKGIQAALNREAKGMQVKAVLEQLGLKNVKIKDFNELTNEGAVKLVQVIREVRAPSGLAGAGAVSPELQQLMMLTQMFPAQQHPQQANPFGITGSAGSTSAAPPG